MAKIAKKKVKKRPVGAPKKKASERKDYRIPVRLTAKKKKEIEKAAAKLGLTSSAYLVHLHDSAK